MKKILSSIASPFCYPIKLQLFLLLPPSIFPKEVWVMMKKKKKKEEKKGRGQMSQHKKGLEQPKFSPNSSKSISINFFKEQK
jgi:hypothetical protein